MVDGDRELIINEYFSIKLTFFKFKLVIYLNLITYSLFSVIQCKPFVNISASYKRKAASISWSELVGQLMRNHEGLGRSSIFGYYMLRGQRGEVVFGE